jgi:hypothetical protein
VSPIKVAIFPSCLLVGCTAISSARGNIGGKKFLPPLLGSSALKTNSSSNQKRLVISSPLFKFQIYMDSISLRRVDMELGKNKYFLHVLLEMLQIQGQ